MTIKLFSAATWLRGDQNIGYAALPLPSSRDSQIAELIRRWLEMDGGERQRSAALVEPQHHPTLLTFAERMASLAVRNRDPDLVKLGLIAAGLDEAAGEKRDSVAVLGLLFRASQKTEMNVSSRFIRVARLLPPKAARSLLIFSRRPPHERAIEAMGYSEGMDKGGFRFTRVGQSSAGVVPVAADRYRQGRTEFDRQRYVAGRSSVLHS